MWTPQHFGEFYAPGTKPQLVPSTNLGVEVYICKIKVGTVTNYEGYLIQL